MRDSMKSFNGLCSYDKSFKANLNFTISAINKFNEKAFNENTVVIGGNILEKKIDSWLKVLI